MNKAVFFDRDGVINSNANHYYVYRWEDFQLLPDIVESMKVVHDAGFLIIIISNQSGIAKGEYEKQDADAVHNKLIELLKIEGITVSEAYYCPHHPSFSKCLCRKPDSLMLEKALARFSIVSEKSYLIGDSVRDIQAAEKVGIKGFLSEANTSVLDICKKIVAGSEQ